MFVLPFFHCKIWVDKMSGGPHVRVTKVTLWADMDLFLGWDKMSQTDMSQYGKK